MRWKQTLAFGALGAIAGLIAGGVAGNLIVQWYDFNAFEGAPQFFAACIALLGSMSGAIVGVAMALIAGRKLRSPTRMAAVSVASIFVLTTAVTVSARLLADIPPKVDGNELYLLVELRTPAGYASPAAALGAGHLKLGATGLQGIRTWQTGPLFKDDAREVNGQWVVPGAARVFTSRGGRVIEASIGTSELARLDVPLPAHPGSESRQWSEWLPDNARRDQFSFRYKVVTQRDPLRIQSFGRFTIETTVNRFYTGRGASDVSAISEFRVRYDGEPVSGVGRLSSIALVAAPQTVLLVHEGEYWESSVCHLLIDTGSRLEIRPFGQCQAPTGRVLTSDLQRFVKARDELVPAGWVDLQTFATPGLFLVDASVFDTRDLTVAPFDSPSAFNPRGSPPPLDLSPDGRSIVWFAHDQSQDVAPKLGVTDWKGNRSYTLPIHRDRMRFIGFETLDPAWVEHHFEWRPGPDGIDRLVERQDFVPLPYRGQLDLRGPGEAQGYILTPAGKPLANEVVRILVEELHAERLPDARDGRRRVRVDGKVVYVMDGSTLVAVTMWFGEADPVIMKKIATHLDAAMATGKYDELFRAADQKGP